MGGSWSNVLQTLQRWYTHSRQRSEKDKLHQSFITQATKAVEEGDLEALKALHQEAGTAGFGGLEYIQCAPPLLLLAASCGQVSIVIYLLELDFDIDATDIRGMSALHEACKFGHHAVLELLLSRSKDIDKRDIWGRTPLIKAVVFRNTHAARILLKRGANPNAVDLYGMTPLTTVINYNLPHMVRLLVSHGADLNLICRHHHQYSGPPLYKAINNQNLDLVEELLRLGASTQPCQSHVSLPTSGGSMPAWSHMGFPNLHSSIHGFQYENAVLMAMSEVVKRGVQLQTSTSLDILMQVVAAHGLQLGSSHEVMMRVLLASRDSENSHSPGEAFAFQSAEHDQPRPAGSEASSGLTSNMISSLLLKLHLCSNSWHEPDTLEGLSNPGADRRDANGNVGDVARHRDDRGHNHGVEVIAPQQATHQAAENTSSSGRRERPGRKRNALSLHTQARRMARRSLMSSGHNVTWATQHLTCPPALKTLLLLKDIDRAFFVKPPKIFYS